MKSRRIAIRKSWPTLGAAMVAAVFVARAGASTPAQDAPSQVSGEIARLTLDRPADPASSGVLVVGKDRIILPSGLPIELPATALSLGEVFALAPAPCKARAESGLARQDACRAESGDGGDRGSAGADGGDSAGGTLRPPARASVVAALDESGRLVAQSLHVTLAAEPFMGGVTFIDDAQGYLRVNGALRKDDGGEIVRINDPYGVQSDQHGVACGREGNCSPDVRFRLDANTFSVRFVRGNPACLGTDAQACPEANRHLPPDDLLSRIPIRVGDNVLAEGAFVTIGGIRFFSAHALVVQNDPTDGR